MLTSSELVAEIEKLPPVDRVKIIDTVLRATLKPDPVIEMLWAEEAQRRLEAYHRGETRAVPYEQVMARLLEKR